MSRLRDLDERTGAARFGRFASYFGGYSAVIIGVTVIAFGIVDVVQGQYAVTAFVAGAFAIAIGVFVGPKYMFRRLVPRSLRSRQLAPKNESGNPTSPE